MRLHPWLNQAYETSDNISIGTSVCAEQANSSATQQTMAANSALGNHNTNNLDSSQSSPLEQAKTAAGATSQPNP